MFYWFLLSLCVIRVPFVGSMTNISDFRQLNSNSVELHETEIIVENRLSSVNKFDKCKVCVVFLEDLKMIINGTASSPIASQIMVERCEDKLGDKIIFEPVCELILRELVRVMHWINSLIHPDNICNKLHVCA